MTALVPASPGAGQGLRIMGTEKNTIIAIATQIRKPISSHAQSW
ncbi:hypothetical protein ACFSTC_06850 [Nonomuraea ferruginea]